MPYAEPAPAGIDQATWARLVTADSLVTYLRGRNRQTLPRHVRDTVFELVRAACGGDSDRAKTVVTTALEQDEPISVTWLTFNAEWSIHDRLLKVDIRVPGSGDYVGLAEQQDGTWHLSVSHNGGADVQITLPARILADLVHRYTRHVSPPTNRKVARA